jgi:virginiamycin B lyase
VCLDGLCVAGPSRACGATTAAVPSAAGPLGATGTVVELDVPTACSSPYGITATADGNVWFTEFAANKIGLVTPAGELRELAVPSWQIDRPGHSGPTDIAAAPDGSAWYWEIGTLEQLGHVLPAGAIHVDSTSPLGQEPAHLAIAADGTVAIAMSGGGFGMYTAGLGASSFGVGVGIGDSRGIASDGKGSFWVTRTPGSVSRVTDFAVAIFEISTTDAAPHGIVVGPDGNLWIAETSANAIARVTNTGAVTAFTLPTPNARPTGIARGLDGNLWFTETGADQIGRIGVDGTITEFPLPTVNSAPTGIAVAADGSVWFVETGANKVGRIAP